MSDPRHCLVCRKEFVSDRRLCLCDDCRATTMRPKPAPVPEKAFSTKETGRPCTLEEAHKVLALAMNWLMRIPVPSARQVDSEMLAATVQLAGSARREKPLCNDVDLLIVDRMGPAVGAMVRRAFREQGFTGGDVKLRGRVNGIHVDVLFTTPQCAGAALLHHTGSVDSNIWLRARARRMNMTLSEYGLYRDDGIFLKTESTTEEGIYKALKTPFVPPCER